MANELVVADNRQLDVWSPEVIRQQVNIIQEVKQAVMQDGVHYGKIPGCGEKPTLLKPGAEKLALTFRLAPELQVEDLSTPGIIRYRILCLMRHIGTGAVWGSGIGECSSEEDKYAWKSAGKKEYDATPESRRRIKYYYEKETLQIRTNPYDVANTILKMAGKRAKVDAVLAATGGSDFFTQDIEDMTDEQRGEERPPRKARPAGNAPSADAPSPQKFDVIAMLEQLDFTETGSDGKQKPTKEGFAFIKKLGVPSKWREWTESDKQTVFHALHQAIKDKDEEVIEGEVTDEQATMDEITDPFEDQ